MKTKKKFVRLTAPEEWWDLTEIQRKDICNGCGAKGGVDYVPDTMYGLSVKEACDIHDFCYHIGMDRWEADIMFYSNMRKLINRGSRWLRWLRNRRAYTYFKAVRIFGKKAYDKSNR